MLGFVFNELGWVEPREVQPAEIVAEAEKYVEVEEKYTHQDGYLVLGRVQVYRLRADAVNAGREYFAGRRLAAELAEHKFLEREGYV